MGAVYASVADVRLLRPLTAQEIEQAPTLLENASVKLRQAAREYGYDLDGLIAADTSGDYALLVKAVTVQAVIRAFNSITDNTPPASEYSAPTAFPNSSELSPTFKSISRAVSRGDI